MVCSMPGFPILHCLPEFAQTHIQWFSDAIQPFHSLWPPSPPVLNPSQHQGLFQWVSSHIRWSKTWSFSFSTSPSKGYSGLIFFRIGWFGLCAVQGILKSVLQYHILKASILWHSAFFTVQFAHLYVAAGKIIPLTILNMLSRFVIAFLPRSKHLLISWLQSPSTVILKPRK